MENIQEKIIKHILQDSNNKIEDINNLNQYLTQYSQTITHTIPEKYQQTITNQLQNLQKNNTPLIYEIQKLPDQDYITLTILNYGVTQREQILPQIQKK